jgi:hypothetical protein
MRGRFTRGLGMARTGNLAGDAHLQLAQDAKADAMIRKSLATADRGDRPINFVNFTAKAAMPARYVLERADWASAACSGEPPAPPTAHERRGNQASGKQNSPRLRVHRGNHSAYTRC